MLKVCEATTHDDFYSILIHSTATTVKLAIDKTNGEQVAVKIMDKSKAYKSVKDQLSLSLVISKELEILKSVQHPNIISIRGTFSTASFLCLFLERMEVCSLLSSTRQLLLGR